MAFAMVDTTIRGQPVSDLVRGLQATLLDLGSGRDHRFNGDDEAAPSAARHQQGAQA